MFSVRAIHPFNSPLALPKSKTKKQNQNSFQPLQKIIQVIFIFLKNQKLEKL